jgi:hypothetical protein
MPGGPSTIDSAAVLSAIEKRFPRIAWALCELWGKGEYRPYLLSLVFDERGARQGFPTDVADELMMLFILTERTPGEFDIWHESDSRT